MLQEVLYSFLTLSSLDIFGTSFLLVLLTVFSKYIVKIVPLGDPDKVPFALKRQAQFEVLRIGEQLTILGLVSFLAVFQLALRGVGEAMKSRLGVMNAFFVILHLLLFLGAVAASARFNSAEKGFFRGILLPGAFGWVSILCSAGFFYFVVSGGLDG